MKIQHLTNSIVKIGTVISEDFNACKMFNIGTAFIDSSAIDIIEHCLKKNRKLIKGEVLIGVYGYFNKKADLIRLKEIAKKYSEKFQVQISKDKSFHWKYYYFENASSNIGSIGSANFTNGGLGTNSELLIKITESNKVDGGSLNKLQSSFRKQWNNSSAISVFPIDYYPIINRNNLYRKVDKEFNAFFISKNYPGFRSIRKDGNTIVYYLTDDLKASTKKKILGYNPSWGKSDINYFVCDCKRSFEYSLKAKNVLIISRERKDTYCYKWVSIIDSCDEVKTEDGKYFVAYKGKDKLLSKKRQEELLNNFDINLKAKKKKFFHKVLGKNQQTQMRKLLT
jgi:HKD family nuclease